MAADLVESGGQFRPAQTVDRDRQLAELHAHFCGQVVQPAQGFQPPLRGIGDDDHEIDFGDDPPGEVLQTRLVVDDHVGVVAGDFLDGLPEDVVGVAIAAGSFGAAHGDEVEVVGLDEAFGDLQLQHLLLGDAGGHALGGDLAGLLADTADGGGGADAQGRIEAGVGIGIDGQDRPAAARHQARDQQRRNGRLADAAFAGDRHGIGHEWRLSTPAFLVGRIAQPLVDLSGQRVLGLERLRCLAQQVEHFLGVGHLHRAGAARGRDQGLCQDHLLIDARVGDKMIHALLELRHEGFDGLLADGLGGWHHAPGQHPAALQVLTHGLWGTWRWFGRTRRRRS